MKLLISIFILLVLILRPTFHRCIILGGIFNLFLLLQAIHPRQLFFKLSPLLLFLLPQQFQLFLLLCFSQHSGYRPFRDHFVLCFSLVITLNQQFPCQKEFLSGLQAQYLRWNRHYLVLVAEVDSCAFFFSQSEVFFAFDVLHSFRFFQFVNLMFDGAAFEIVFYLALRRRGVGGAVVNATVDFECLGFGF